MRLCSIASGSSGNCVYVGSDTTHLLVDVGISAKRIEAGAATLGLKLSEIDGIFITHEHSDHIKGLGVISRKYGIPIYATAGTIKEIRQTASLGEIDDSLFCSILPDQKYIIKDMTLYPMRTSHDAAEPVAYKITHDKKKVGIVTDLGCYNDYTIECMKDLDAIYLEANHDINMLQVGSYPYYLKRRILGEKGHLSNEAAGKLLAGLLNDHIEAVVLAHLSKENNLPELAYEAVKLELMMSDSGYKDGDFPIYVANRSEVSQMIEIA
ncbi:MAG: MBL fold metallo-hydrolase [Lachnospiraceae bacterium]|nr:MBL fold metallo-hydrolase [Lachnospiraceae bacterium]